LHPKPSLVVIVSGWILIIHWNHLVFFGWSLCHNLLANHLNDLLTDDLIVQVKAFKAGNQLAWSCDMILCNNQSVLFSIMLE
jgi:hypothetical protein